MWWKVLNGAKNIFSKFYMKLFDLINDSINNQVFSFFFLGLSGTGTLKTVEHVEQIGENLQKIDKQTEHTNPMSMSSRWQKQAAR